MDHVEPPRPARRRTQAERSAATRERVISAAQKVLWERGYSGASMLSIRAAAGVSMGALQHQFPTKAMLMEEIVRRHAAARTERLRDAMRRSRDPVERLLGLVDATVRASRSPEMAAMLEIQLARRNDGELNDRTKPILDRFDRRVTLWAALIVRSAGVSDARRAPVGRLLNNAVIRGMTIEFINGTPPDQIDEAVGIWRDLLPALVFGEDKAAALRERARAGASRRRAGSAA